MIIPIIPEILYNVSTSLPNPRPDNAYAGMEISSMKIRLRRFPADSAIPAEAAKSVDMIAAASITP